MPRKKGEPRGARKAAPRAPREPAYRAETRARRKSPRAAQTGLGWTRLRGTARRYRNDDTGEEISERQYRQNLLYKGQSLEKVAKLRGSPLKRYTRITKARQAFLKSQGITATLKEIQRSDEMKQIVKELKRLRDPRPNGPLARLLEELGYRVPGDMTWVGDS